MTGTAAIWARRRRRRGCRAKKKEERRRRRREGERASSRDKNSCREGTTASKQARDDRKGVGKRRLELGETCYKGTVDSYIGAWQVTEPPPVGSHECEPCGGSCWYSPFAASTLCPYLHKLWVSQSCLLLLLLPLLLLSSRSCAPTHNYSLSCGTSSSRRGSGQTLPTSLYFHCYLFGKSASPPELAS